MPTPKGVATPWLKTPDVNRQLTALACSGRRGVGGGRWGEGVGGRGRKGWGRGGGVDEEGGRGGGVGA